jgi:hypothetical protein
MNTQLSTSFTVFAMVIEEPLLKNIDENSQTGEFQKKKIVH